jgi:hypothetical protein
MTRSLSAYPFSLDWRNTHYDTRQPWLVSPWPTPERSRRSWRSTRLLATIAGLVGSLPPEWRPKRRQATT